MDLHYNNNNNNSNEHGNGRHDQIVSQFLLKTLHIILDSRVVPSINNLSSSFHHQPPPPPAPAIKKKNDKWFNLALDRPTAFLHNLNFWHRNLMEPMIIDIILLLKPPSSPDFVETVIERWVVHYESSKLITDSSVSYKKTYKKSIILLRSLYSIIRLLPAYRAFRKPSSHFHIHYKVSSFTSPFTTSQEHLMKHYTFFPVEAQHGRLSISVTYRHTLSDFNLETSTSFPPEIITDYVGSPATDPFRAFPPMSVKPLHATSLPVRDIQHPPQRPHSWTGGAPPFISQPAHRSSSGRYDSPTTSLDVYGQRNRPPPTFDDYQLSPPFSPSPSPSPPTYLSGGNYMQSRLRSETAPVSIPNPLITRTPRHLSPNLSDPNRHSLPPPSPRSTRYEVSSHESPSGIRSFKKSEMSRVGDLSSGSGSGSANHYSSHKVYKDDSGRFSSLPSSSGSPRIGFSRSSSRLSLQEELDDIDFSCPFVVDDVDNCESPVSESFGGKKSQDAAVGALVRMLRRAPPLREDSSSCYSNGNGGSGLYMSGRKTSTDALEDLKAYTDMKHLILSKSGTNSLIH